MTGQGRAGQRGARGSWIDRAWTGIRLLSLALLLSGGTVTILLLPDFRSSSRYNLQLGDIAVEDILAPRDISYISQIETQQARQAARAAVTEIYDAPDARVGRAQVRLAGQVMDYVAVVRADPLADSAQKDDFIAAIRVLSLDEGASSQLLSMSADDYSQLRAEVLALVEESMSGAVREGQVDQIIRGLELRVSANLPETLISLAVGIASDLVAPNSYLNLSQTEEARTRAEAAVPEIRNTFQEGEVVVRAGEAVDEIDIEALEALDLRVSGLTRYRVIRRALAGGLVTIVLGLYAVAVRGRRGPQPHLLLLIGIFLVFLLGAQWMVTGPSSLAYLYPAAALSLALSSLFGVNFAALNGVVLAALVGLLGNSLELALISGVGSLLAAGTLRREPRLSSFFEAGVIISLGSMIAFLMMQLTTLVDLGGLLQAMGLLALNGLLSAGAALVILFIVGYITGLPTSLRLLDLSRPDHPLQRQLQRTALGTYQHSLSVAALAEAAGEEVGADVLLIRVGCLYHDIGKMNNPAFFVENRAEGGPDPHEDLSPLASARNILAHVPDGVSMGSRHRLPPRLLDFMREHHGTMPVLFFVRRAREEAEATGMHFNEADFRYQGPRPRSRETGIVMLCDACESATRAARPSSGEQIEAIVEGIFAERLEFAQLDDSGLTLGEVAQIKSAIIRTLKGMYHPRVLYPGQSGPK